MVAAVPIKQSNFNNNLRSTIGTYFGINRSVILIYSAILGLPPVVFHSLRHCSASLKLQIGGGNIKAVQGDTGHAQSRMVTDLYAHTNNEERRRLAEKVETDFFQKRADTPQEKSLDNAAEQAYRLLQGNPDIARLIIATLQKQA